MQLSWMGGDSGVGKLHPIWHTWVAFAIGTDQFPMGRHVVQTGGLSLKLNAVVLCPVAVPLQGAGTVSKAEAPVRLASLRRDKQNRDNQMGWHTRGIPNPRFRATLVKRREGLCKDCRRRHRRRDTKSAASRCSCLKSQTRTLAALCKAGSCSQRLLQNRRIVWGDECNLGQSPSSQEARSGSTVLANQSDRAD